MLTYESISNDWFFRRLPTGKTFEEYEAEKASADRARTRVVFVKMRQGFPETLRQNFGIAPLSPTLEGIKMIDRLVAPDVVNRWLEISNSADPNNYFKLTVSEIAVFLGDAWLRSFGGKWLYARMPNYADSYLESGRLKVLVFDMAMKKCSEDLGGESLAAKWAQFASMSELQACGVLN